METVTLQLTIPEDLPPSVLNCLILRVKYRIKSFYISYDAVNESNTFGAGRIFLEVSKEVKLSSLSVKAKGKAKVLWSERYGQVTVVYHAKEKYFSQERVLVQERAAGGA
ncbi:hypothetical protein Z043_102959, partial [Scleropages formosus]